LNVSVHSPFNSFIQVIAVWDIFLEAIKDGFVFLFCSLQRRIPHGVEGMLFEYYCVLLRYVSWRCICNLDIMLGILSLLTSSKLLPASKIVDKVIISYRGNEISREVYESYG